MSFDTPTEKQTRYVDRIVKYLGEDKVLNYIKYFYPEASLNSLSKNESQKIIKGLSARLPWGGNGMSMGWIQSQ